MSSRDCVIHGYLGANQYHRRYRSTDFSLSLRLFANVLSGTVMMALIYGLLGFLLQHGLQHFMCILICSQEQFRRMYSVC